MKKEKFLIIICISISSLNAFGQAGASIVNDPILTKLATKEAVDREVIKTSTLKSLEESVVQTKKLEETYQLTKKAYDKLSEVNSYIKQYKSLEYALKRQKTIMSRTKKMIGDFEKSDVFTVKEYTKIADNLNRCVKNSQEIINMFDLVLQNGLTKMNDAERITILMELEDDLKEKHALTEATLDYFEDIQRQREAVNALDTMGKMMY